MEPVQCEVYQDEIPIDFEMKIVIEGKTRLEIPDPESFRAESGDYVPSLAEVFYNPRMELCRDISVAVAQVAERRIGRLKMCDPLSGVGVRGIRYLKEVSEVSRGVLNDRSEKAAVLIEKNLQLNCVGAEVYREDANVCLWKNKGKFNFIDLDPFGSPAPFLEASFAAMEKRGVLAFTATDTAPLCGSQPKACLRRYGAVPLRTEYCRELGLRILIGYAQRVAGKHEFAVRVVLSHGTAHYFRVYLIVEHGAKKADEGMKRLGWVAHCFGCGRRTVFSWPVPRLQKCLCGRDFSYAGPLWIGPLGDRNIVAEVMEEVTRRGFKLLQQELHLLELLVAEVEGPPTFYEVNSLAGILRRQPPKVEKLLDGLRAMGFFASRTHFCPTGFRTDAPYEKIIEMFNVI